MRQFRQVAMVTILALSASSHCFSQQPCDTGAVNDEIATVVVRSANNEVHLYAKTWTSGLWREYFLPNVSGRPKFNNVTYLDVERAKQATIWSGTAEYHWYYTLSQTGPGIYTLDSKHWVRSPYCEQFGWTWFTYTGSGTNTILRPVHPDYAPGANVAYYLGGVLTSGTYRAQTTLAAGNSNGAVGTPTWSITSGSDYGTLSCSSCTQNTYTATKATTGCMIFNIVIKTNYGGFESDPFYVFNNSPGSIENGVYSPDNPPPGEVGYVRKHALRPKNICGEAMRWVAVNESFTNGRYGPDFGGGQSNWPLSFSPGTWASEQQFDISGFFLDVMWEYQRAGKVPAPMPLGTNGYDEGNPSTVTIVDQWFKGGPTTPGSGVLMWGVNQIHYKDHAKNN